MSFRIRSTNRVPSVPSRPASSSAANSRHRDGLFVTANNAIQFFSPLVLSKPPPSSAGSTSPTKSPRLPEILPCNIPRHLPAQRVFFIDSIVANLSEIRGGNPKNTSHSFYFFLRNMLAIYLKSYIRICTFHKTFFCLLNR